MKQTIALTILALCTAGTARAGSVQAALQDRLAETPANSYVAVLVYLTEQVDLDRLERDFNDSNAALRERHETVVLALQATVEDTQGDLRAYLAQQQATGSVRSFSPFWIVNAIAVEALPAEIVTIAARADVGMIYVDFGIELIEPVDEPDRAQLDEQGGIAGITSGVDAVRAPEVWALGIDGAGTLVATLDTGVDGNHEALRDRWRGVADARYDGHPDWAWFDPVGQGSDFPFDARSHGTHTMGSVCGGLPGEQVGVAPGAQWISAGVIDRVSIEQTVSDAMLAFEWMLDPDGDPGTNWDVPDSCSNSWGLLSAHGRPPCDQEFWSFLDALESSGVVIIFSAGNEGGSGLRRPADRATDDFRTFAVAAVDANRSGWPIANFSSRGPTQCTPDGSDAIKPDIAAPGVNVRSSVPGNQYSFFSGTSMASPHVNGVVALMRQANPGMPVTVIKQIIFETAFDLGGAGEDNSYGWGMIDAFEAVQAIGDFRTLRFAYPNGRPQTIDFRGGETLRVEVTGINAVPASGTGLLHVDDGSGFVAIPMQLVSENVYDAVFPPVVCGARVAYYVSSEDTDGGLFTDPRDAPDAFFTTQSTAPRVVLFADDFEVDHGWVPRNLGAESGDFERGVPVNDPNWPWDPTSDSDGSGQCWLTWNALGDTDVDRGRVRLISPVMDLSVPGMSFKYDYFLNMDSFGFDKMLVEVNDTTQSPNWTEVALHNQSGGLSWRTQVITRDDLLDAGLTLSTRMKIRWTVSDVDQANNVEGGLDAFELSGFDCPSPFGLGDLNCDGSLNAFDIEPFLLALFDPDEYPNQYPDCDINLADINADGNIDAFDIGPFLELLFP